jgi:hypothetical protein
MAETALSDARRPVRPAKKKAGRPFLPTIARQPRFGAVLFYKFICLGRECWDMKTGHGAKGFFMSRQVFSSDEENTPNDRIGFGFRFHRFNG